MKIRMNYALEILVSEFRRADALMAKEQWQEASQILQSCRLGARELGVAHALISWRLSLCLNSRGDPEGAFRAAVEAVDQDPLGHPFRSSVQVLGELLRDALAAADPDDPVLERWYQLLVENDAADEGSHLAMARHLVLAGNAEQALELLRAVTTLSPLCEAAWSLRAELVRAAGDTERAEGYELEALASRNAIAAAQWTSQRSL